MISSCTFGVSTLSSSIKAASPWQLEGGKEKVSAPEAEGSPGDCSSLGLGECRFTTAWACKTELRHSNLQQPEGGAAPKATGGTMSSQSRRARFTSWFGMENILSLWTWKKTNTATPKHPGQPQKALSSAPTAADLFPAAQTEFGAFWCSKIPFLY